jgi:hypothetical protein
VQLVLRQPLQAQVFALCEAVRGALRAEALRLPEALRGSVRRSGSLLALRALVA